LPVDAATILAQASAYPALVLSPLRASELALEVNDLELACEQALERFGPGSNAPFEQALRHNAPPRSSGVR